MNELRNAIMRMYSRLEQLSEDYEELTDTDVREAMHETLNYYFVWAMPMDRLPCNYFMFSEAGDRAVAEVIDTFLNEATALAQHANVPAGPDRLAMLQDSTILTARGEHYDLYIGHASKPLEPRPLQAHRFERNSDDHA